MVKSDLTSLQISILEFARSSNFHGTLSEFIERTNQDLDTTHKDNCISALKELKKKRIVSMPPDVLNSWIGVTNFGWNVMNWKR